MQTPWWWRDAIVLAQLQVVFSVAAAALAFLAVVYAWRVARRQFTMMEEQTSINKRQEAMAQQQGEIAETQHKIMREQLSRKTDLRVRSGLQNRSWDSEAMSYGPTAITLRVENGGNRAADGFYWEVFIPRELAFRVKFIDDDGEELSGRFAPFSETEVYDKRDGHYAHKLFPWGPMDIVRLSVESEHPSVHEFTIKWRVRSEDGVIPREGLGEIRFRRVEDGTYAVMHPEPGNEEGS
jgi:hypothetical protein